MALERYLDAFEKCLKHANPIIVADVECRIDSERLAAALEAVCKSDLLVGGRINNYSSDEPTFFVPDDEVCAEFRVCDGHDADALLKGEREFDVAKSLASLDLVRGRDGDLLALRVNHAIVDGPGIFHVLSDLWRRYCTGDALVSGIDAVMSGISEIPTSPFELLEQRWEGIPDAEYRLGELYTRVPDADLLALSRDRVIEKIHLTENETARLLARARSSRTTLHSVLCGSIFLAQRIEAARGAESASGSDRATPMMFISSVDLRSCVSPAVGVRETTNFVAACAGTVEVGIDSNVIEVGREIKEKMAAGVAERKLRLLSDLGGHYPRVETPLEPKWAIAQVNNGRVIPSLGSGDDCRVKEVKLVVPRNDAGGGPFPFYGATTYGGRLSVVCNYPSALFSEDEIGSVVARIKKQLCA